MNYISQHQVHYQINRSGSEAYIIEQTKNLKQGIFMFLEIKSNKLCVFV